MSPLTFVNEQVAGQNHSDICRYSHRFILPGGIVKCSGQGGCDTTGELDANQSLAPA